MRISESGVLVIDKPRGMTSHDVVSRVRRARKTREVGHAGTLDPMATGVLVVLVGEATKLAPYLTADDKEYEAEIALGVETDSLDADGNETRRAPVPEKWADRLASATLAERARTSQVPPSVSAVHVDGARAHERVRRGEEVVLAPRDVSVRAIDVLDVGKASLRVKLLVSKGYYVRAFARDLAERLGTVAHLVALRRVRSGVFSLDRASRVEDAEAAPLVSVADAAKAALASVVLTAEGEARARVGKVVGASERSPAIDGVQAWLSESGALVAIAEAAGDVGKVRRGFSG